MGELSPYVGEAAFARTTWVKRSSGGSHLCASNYCARYRPTARQPQEVDLSAAHLGFRTVLNKPLTISP
jgi:formylglycine-generating enzyme required for sulfatase activity